MPFHAISGVPRSGSTLLCNVLCQNPRFWATSTDFISDLWAAVISTANNHVEFKAQMGKDPEAAKGRVRRALLGLMGGWYEGIDREVVFSKDRGWALVQGALREVFPDARLILTVRHPLDVVASCAKQEMKHPLFSPDSAEGRTLEGRFNALLDPDHAVGIIGKSMRAVMDVYYRKQDCFVLKCEIFQKDPESALRALYSYIGEEWFDHDCDDVVDLSDDPDHLYNFRFPHQGSGKVTYTSGYWRQVIQPAFAARVMANSRVREFCEVFGYPQGVDDEMSSSARAGRKGKKILSPRFMGNKTPVPSGNGKE
jgi:sulfotransferase